MGFKLGVKKAGDSLSGMRDGFVSIATYADPVEASMDCECIRAAGIEAELSNALAASSMFGAGNPIADLVLYVEADRIEEARRLIAKSRSGFRESLAEGNEADALPIYDGFYRTDWNKRERAAEVAYRASVVGWFVPGVSWYSIWKLLDVVSSNLPLNPQARKRAAIAGLMAVVPALAVLAFLLMLLRR